MEKQDCVRRRVHALSNQLYPNLPPDSLSNAFVKCSSPTSDLKPQDVLESSKQNVYPIVLIGSSILDVQATPAQDSLIHQGGSTPGSIRFVAGGVARNIAHDLWLLMSKRARPKDTSHIKQRLFLISAIGDDSAGQSLIHSLQSLDMTQGLIIVPNGRTPTVSIIFDDRGDVAASVADVALLEQHINAQSLSKYRNVIINAKHILLDADLSPNTIENICLGKSRQQKLWFEPVSASKSIRATHVLPFIDYTSPNIIELKCMAEHVFTTSHLKKNTLVGNNKCENTRCLKDDCTLHHGRDHFDDDPVVALLTKLRPCLQILLETGLSCIVLTLGAQGAALCRLSSNQASHTRCAISIFYVPALPAVVKNCSGAGDCLVAGFLYALCDFDNCSDEQALAYGVAASKAAVESSSNVPTSMSADSMESDALAAMKSSRKLRVQCGCCCQQCFYGSIK